MQVRVWNDNVHDYSETFREQKISIPAKKFIMMDDEQAHLFVCNFAPIKCDADGNPVPEGYKMVRIERNSDAAPVEVKVNENVCHACQYEGASKADLSEHIEASHKSIAVVDEEAEREIKVRKNKKAG